MAGGAFPRLLGLMLLMSLGCAVAVGDSVSLEPSAQTDGPLPGEKPEASQSDELQMAEMEWKDAYDSTVAPGKLKANITKTPGATGETWLKNMVETQKKGDEEELMRAAEAALQSGMKLMQPNPKDDVKPPAGDIAQMATIKQQEKSTEDLKKIVQQYSAKDAVVVAMQEKSQKAQRELAQAESEAKAAEDDLKSQVMADNQDLAQKRAEAQEELKKHMSNKKRVMESAAEAVAQARKNAK